jgi:hypothetical protein
VIGALVSILKHCAGEGNRPTSWRRLKKLQELPVYGLNEYRCRKKLWYIKVGTEEKKKPVNIASLS